jgi:hypothetical protein
MMYWVPVTVAKVGIICGRLVGEGVNGGIVVAVASSVGSGVFEADFVGLGVFEATFSGRAVLAGGMTVAASSGVGDRTTATAEAMSVGVGLPAPFA